MMAAVGLASYILKKKMLPLGRAAIPVCEFDATATATIGSSATITEITRPSVRSHRRSVPSLDAESARSRSSAATWLIQPECPCRTRRMSPVARSHRRRVWS